MEIQGKYLLFELSLGGTVHDSTLVYLTGQMTRQDELYRSQETQSSFYPILTHVRYHTQRSRPSVCFECGADRR